MKFLVILIFCYINLSSTDPVTLKDEVCGLPHSVRGICKAHIPRWSYDFGNEECVEFIYGGCGGNKNRFGSLEECQEKCVE